MFSRLGRKNAFTLIELLVVIAIIAILAIVVVLTLNPAQMLAQSRDANRISDMATLNSALNLYITDQSGVSSFSLGSSLPVYTSLLDPSSTSTTGTDCSNLGLPTSTYHCAASSTLRYASSTGWIPVNFASISSGNPLGSLPVDPTNQTSSGLFYTYQTNGSQYEVIAPMESQKYKVMGQGPLGDGIDVQGSMPASGPVGWWPLNEGTGTVAYDISGGQNNGMWYGTAAGTNGTHYAIGSHGGWAGDFDGTSNYIAVGTDTMNSQNAGTLTAWVDLSSLLPSASNGDIFGVGSQSNGNGLWAFGVYGLTGTQSRLRMGYNYPSINYVYGSTNLNTNTWYFVALTGNGSLWTFYVNGRLENLTVQQGSNTGAWWNAAVIGSMYYDIGMIYRAGSGNINYFPGLISDVRIYNRALSAAEISAIYNSGK